MPRPEALARSLMSSPGSIFLTTQAHRVTRRTVTRHQGFWLAANASYGKISHHDAFLEERQ